MLWTVITTLLVLWLLSKLVGVGVGLITLLIVAAVLVLIFNLVNRRRRTI
jgi:hypothetical protein